MESWKHEYLQKVGWKERRGSGTDKVMGVILYSNEDDEWVRGGEGERRDGRVRRRMKRRLGGE